MNTPQMPLWDEFSISGPKSNPLRAWTYQQALDYADELDLPDDDWDFIHQCFSLTESR